MNKKKICLAVAVFCCSVSFLYVHAIVEKPMVVIIPSYNNQKWVENNLQSVFSQNYENYRVIYVDDCSTDNTYESVQKLVEKYEQQNRVTVIHNDIRRGAMANWYTTIHSCRDEEIVVQLDGDDWLAHQGVLAYINKIYTENNIWMTYGQFIEYPSHVIGYAYSKSFSDTVIATNTFRKVGQLPISHLRTFYAWLFKAIKLQDMLYQGNFYTMAWDKVMMAPMIEMAAHHFFCVPEVLYVYNNANPINDHRVNKNLQHSLAWYVLNLPPYEPLDKPQIQEVLLEQDQASVILICRYEPNSRQIENIIKNIRSSRSLQILYPAAADVALISEKFKSSSFTSYNDFDFVQKLQVCLREIDSHYVLLSSDSISIMGDLDLATCILQLKNAHADIFYCTIGGRSHEDLFSKRLPMINRKHLIYAWYPQDKNGSWAIPVVDMTLWPRDLLIDVATRCSALTIENFCCQLERNLKEQNKLGLMFSEGQCKENSI